jgi:hypothetical protein
MFAAGSVSFIIAACKWNKQTEFDLMTALAEASKEKFTRARFALDNVTRLSHKAASSKVTN